MELQAEAKQHIGTVANDTLAQLDLISTAAKSKLEAGTVQGADALANLNSLTAAPAIQRLERISKVNMASYQILADEPAIARIVVMLGDGNERTYYICRTSPVSGVKNLASYRAPVGRLASLSIGDEFTLPDGTVVEVLERAQLRPVRSSGGWDSQDTMFEFEQFGTFTIESLRGFLAGRTSKDIPEDLLDQLLAEEAELTGIKEGKKRDVIAKMGLRDQPILDRFQDEIFRLPLDRRLLILGPPGTGKTTTLIRRLGQKLDADYLEEDERRLVEAVASAQGISHANSWLMFTPTELLKQYLKEAFAREGVAASDQRIRTWQDYRRELARNALGILKSSTGGGAFVLREYLPILTEAAHSHPIQWFSEFDAWQRKTYSNELSEAASILNDADSPEVKSLGEQLKIILEKPAHKILAPLFEALAVEIPKAQGLIASLKEVSDAKIKAALNLQLNRSRTFLDEMARFLESLQQAQPSEQDEQDEDSEDEDDVAAPQVGRTAAVNAYMLAVRAQARAAVSKRAISKASRNGKMIEWLGNRGLEDADRIEVGTSLLIQASIRRFTNPVKRYLDGMPRRYRAFRRETQASQTWYQSGRFDSRDIHPLELDIVLLATLRAANGLINKPSILRDIDSPAWSSLKSIQERYCNQILVDEATDFSPIQLACMAALANPRLRSFFACGDFNQRLTTWGARSMEELKWIFADFDIKEISISYRQSRQLNELAQGIIQAIGGAGQGASLPESIQTDGFSPALLEHGSDQSAIVGWLADRICEIERSVGWLPSVAIFVNGEDDVTPLAQALNTALAEHNIQVTACHEGQAVGQDSNVRVFDIQHIKGLEFEAVFFVGIDQLAAEQPALFDKYLYVGATRAATYLGLTCEVVLPSMIESLRAHFGPDWRQ